MSISFKIISYSIKKFNTILWLYSLYTWYPWIKCFYYSLILLNNQIKKNNHHNINEDGYVDVAKEIKEAAVR